MMHILSGAILSVLFRAIHVIGDCTVPTNFGECTLQRWYFDPSKSDCEHYIIGGYNCDGGALGFKTMKSCRLSCNPSMFTAKECRGKLCPLGVDCLDCRWSHPNRFTDQHDCCMNSCDSFTSPNGVECRTDACGSCHPRCHDIVTDEYLGDAIEKRCT